MPPFPGDRLCRELWRTVGEIWKGQDAATFALQFLSTFTTFIIDYISNKFLYGRELHSLSCTRGWPSISHVLLYSLALWLKADSLCAKNLSTSEARQKWLICYLKTLLWGFHIPGTICFWNFQNIWMSENSSPFSSKSHCTFCSFSMLFFPCLPHFCFPHPSINPWCASVFLVFLRHCSHVSVLWVVSITT